MDRKTIFWLAAGVLAYYWWVYSKATNTNARLYERDRSAKGHLHKPQHPAELREHKANVEGASASCDYVSAVQHWQRFRGSARSQCAKPQCSADNSWWTW